MTDPHAHLRRDGATKAWLLPGLSLSLLAFAPFSSRFSGSSHAYSVSELKTGAVQMDFADWILIDEKVNLVCGSDKYATTNLTSGSWVHSDPVSHRANSAGWQPTLSLMADLSLCVQLLIMSTIVYLSSQTAKDIPGRCIRYQAPVANVLRATIGSLLLCGMEIAVVDGAWNTLIWDSMGNTLVSVLVLMSLVPLRILFGYAMSANSEYMFHRFVWHSHWSTKTDFPLFRALRRHYIQHYEGHHKQTRDPEVRSLMEQLHEKPVSDAKKLKTETNPRLFLEDAEGLQCTNHGLTTGADDLPMRWKWGCRMHFHLMFLSMPSGTAIFVNAMYGSLIGVLVHCFLVAFMAYIYKHHDKYHANIEKTRQWAEDHCGALLKGSLLECIAGRCLLAIWLSEEMHKTILDHEKHHEDGAEFFGVAPYSRFFVYPIWQTW